MNQGTLHERITRSLAYMLRHQPEEFDLELDAFGYADLSDVVYALNERLGEPIEEEDVREAIEAGDRPRYEIQEDAICALYGHSIAIDPGPPSEPPELLYVGVGSRDAERAEEYGLRGGRRTFLHLALTHDDARETGRRIAPEYSVVTVRARDAWRDGVQFYDRHALFLSEEIATDYLEVGEIHEDGIVRERRFQRDRGRDRGRDRDRGGRSRGGRDRGRDRDRYDDRPRRDERSDRDGRPRGEREPEERPSRDRDELPRREAPAEDRPARTEHEPAGRGSSRSSSAEPSTGFGLGILDPEPKKKDEGPRKPREKRAQKPPRPKPQPTEEPAADPAPEGGGFGSGIF